MDSPLNKYKLEHMPGNDIMSPGQPHRSQPESSFVVTLKKKFEFYKIETFRKNANAKLNQKYIRFCDKGFRNVLKI